MVFCEVVSVCAYLQCNSWDVVCYCWLSHSWVNISFGCTVVQRDWTLTWLGQLGCEPFILPTPTSKSCYKHWGENCGPSVAADGDLWMVYKLQLWNQQKCPKYVIQIDQSEWWGEHYLVRILSLTAVVNGPLMGSPSGNASASLPAGWTQRLRGSFTAWP